MLVSVLIWSAYSRDISVVVPNTVVGSVKV